MNGEQDSPRSGAWKIDWGDLRRTSPISREFGYNRGLPIDRFYIERFLAAHRADIQGRVLEIGDDTYTRQFGGDRVTRADVLHVEEGNPAATYVGSLTDPNLLPAGAFDCLILTQTLHLILDVPPALATITRALKPGGVVLATFPGISQVSCDRWAATWSWSFTRASARRLFAEHFPSAQITLSAYGNAAAATAFLQGIAVEEVAPAVLEAADGRYDMLLAVRAQKPGEAR